MKNPLNDIYKAFLAELRATAEIREVIREGNLIDFTQDISPLKKGISSADVPELILYITGMRGNLHASSTHSFITVNWRFMLSSGSFDTTICTSVSFAILQVLTRWRSFLIPLKLKDNSFVRDVKLVSGDMGLSNPDANRNIKGWASVVDIETDLAFNLNDLKSTD